MEIELVKVLRLMNTHPFAETKLGQKNLIKKCIFTSVCGDPRAVTEEGSSSYKSRSGKPESGGF
jgi:hypothetical protein